LHEGKLDEALQCVAEAEDSFGRNALGGAATLACYAALAYALRGEADLAQRWREAAEERKKNAPDPATVSGLLAFVDAVLDVRVGRYESFSKWVDERWQKLEGALTARTMRPLRLLRAYAVAQGSTGPRNAGAVELIVAPLQPARPGEFAMFEASWPEIHGFLRTMGLS
jgi:hypothetical protein